MWVGWLHKTCRLEGAHHFIVGSKIESGPQVGQGRINPADWGVPNDLERVVKLQVAQKWAGWLNNPAA